MTFMHNIKMSLLSAAEVSVGLKTHMLCHAAIVMCKGL